MIKKIVTWRNDLLHPIDENFYSLKCWEHVSGSVGNSISSVISPSQFGWFPVGSERKSLLKAVTNKTRTDYVWGLGRERSCEYSLTVVESVETPDESKRGEFRISYFEFRIVFEITMKIPGKNTRVFAYVAFVRPHP